MTIPRISVVTPSFNQGQFLETTIRSVLAQEGRGTDFDLQYIVIDGGSIDESRQILERHSGELAYWVSEPDRGQTHAINKGFSQADGEIHAYLNSDDVYQPGTLRRVARAFAQQPQVDLVHGVCLKIDADGHVIGEQVSSIQSLLDMVDLWDVWLRPGGNQNFIQPEVFWTASLAQRLGPFREELHYAMDFDFWLRGFDSGMLALRIDEPLAGFRLHDAQKTTDRLGAIEELIDLVEPFLHRTDDPRLPEDDRRRILDHVELARRSLAGRGVAEAKQLLSLATDRPQLLQSRHFWKQVRRTGRNWWRAA